MANKWNNNEVSINQFLENSQRTFDDTYSMKYINRIKLFLKLLILNSIVCSILMLSYVFRIFLNIDVILIYDVLSMMMLHFMGIIYCVMYWHDFKKMRNGESLYLKTYYPDIWGKIHPFGHVVFRNEYLEYETGKYIPKNTDPVIDAIRKDKRKSVLFILPFILMVLYVVTGLIVS